MSITRANILTDIRDRMGDDAATPYYASALINRQIDKRVLVRATTVINRLDPSFYVKEETVTSVADQADYTVATDFHAIIRVERRYGSAVPYTYIDVPIRIVDDQAVGGWSSPLLALPDTVSRSGKTFALFGKTSYRIEPIPQDTSEVYRVKYQRRPITTDITDGTEVMDIPDAWAGYIALDVIKILFGRRGDPRYGRISDELGQEYANLRKAARRRVAGVSTFNRLERM